MLDSLRSQSQRHWLALATPEKRRFLRHLRAYWDVHRHRIAEEIYRQIDELRRSGALRIEAGRLLSLAEDKGCALVSIRLRGEPDARRLAVDWVVNCTGPECDPRRMKQPFIEDLLAQGAVRSDEFGLGFDADSDGRLIDRQGRVLTSLYTLGPTLRGKLWETVAVPELRVQADVLAGRLLEEIHDLPPTQRRSMQDVSAR